MEISATLVRQLREATGAGMMDCKKALTECQGNLDDAKLFLEKKGITDSRKRAARTASEGLVVTRATDDGRSAFLLEVNCETDFVARNEAFVGFVDGLADRIATERVASVGQLDGLSWDGKTLNEIMAEQLAKVGEKVQVRRLQWVHVPAGKAGMMGSYIHAGGKLGVIAAMTTANEADSKAQATLGLIKDVCMHIAASEPVVVSADHLDAQLVERQKEIFTAQAAETGKPAEICEKIAIGRLNKWKKEVSLMNQPFVKNMDLTVEAHIAQVAKQDLSGPASVSEFLRWKVGEGIEKKQCDLAAEIAALQK